MEKVIEPTPVFLPGKYYGQRSVAGYSPWGHKESDTTEQLLLTYLKREWAEILSRKGCSYGNIC